MPLLAEIADKMPTLREVWMIWAAVGLGAAAVTVVLSLMNLWVGAAAVVVSAIIGMLAFADRSLDAAIVSELGRDYLVQNKVSAFVPFVFACIGWGVVAGERGTKVRMIERRTCF